MIRKPIRTRSGIAPLALMLPPRACPHGKCVYCPTLDAPQSYTPESPVVRRAKRVNYSASAQVHERIQVLESMGHATDKIELIIMGGTFLSYPMDFQYSFIKECYDALNDVCAKNLQEAEEINVSTKHRVVALCIETRPDICGVDEIKRMREFGCTRVELGVQSPDDKLYKKTNRGHTLKDVILATERLKKAGFKVGYHFMPGVPGTSSSKDLAMFKKIFSSSSFKPDQIKIYPCQVIKGAELANLYLKGKYKPYTHKQIKTLLIKMLKLVPSYCRVMRVMREIPFCYLVAGSGTMDLRKEVEDEFRARGIKLKEIRFRETGNNLEVLPSKVKIKIQKYLASKGQEIFLEVSNEGGILFGLLRLRLEKSKKSPAFIRELHVYGKALLLGQHEEGTSQHQGLGKKLMEKAEQIARKKGYKKIRVISGVGVREYYKRLGYVLVEDGYMEKELI